MRDDLTGKVTRREFLKGSAVTLIGGSLALPGFLPLRSWAAEDAVKVGGLFAISGPYAISGTERTEGVQLAVDELNAKGGILGRRVEALIRDEQANPGEEFLH